VVSSGFSHSAPWLASDATYRRCDDEANLSWRLLFTLLAGTAVAGDRPVRVAWMSAPRSAEEKARIFSAAKELRFNTLIVRCTPRICRRSRKKRSTNGMEVLYWHSIECSDNDGLSQVMTAEDEAQYAVQKKWRKPEEQQYQWGGEPVDGRHEVRSCA